MAIEKTITINAETKKAEKNLDKLADSINELVGELKNQQKEIKETSKETSDALEKQNKSAGKLTKGLKKIGGGVKALGVGLKALGIGLIITAFATLTSLFTQNQVVADKLGAAVKSIGIIFNDLFSFVQKNFNVITDAFKNPKKFVKDLGTSIKNNIIERFNSAIKVAGYLGDALKKLFAGDFEGALESSKEAGKEMIDVLTGVDGSAEKIVDLTKKTLDYAKATFKAAEALQKQENAARLAVAQQARLVEQYDRESELQRRIRDDVSKSIDDRIKANEKLGEVLDKQEKAMLSQANAQIQAAQNQLALNESIDNKIALTEALANKEGVLAQITSFRNEQDVNRVSLLQELNDLEQTSTDAEIERQLLKLDLLKELEETELGKLKRDRERLDLENELILEDLERKRELYLEGTQARIDAEEEYKTRKLEIENEIALNEKEINDQKLENQKQLTEEQNKLEKSKTDARFKAVDDLRAIANEEGSIGKTLFLIKQGLAVKEILTEAKKTLAFSKQAVAKSTIAVAEGTAQTAKIGFPQNIPMLIGFAAQAAGIISAVKSASQAAGSVGGGGVGGGGVGDVPTITPPAFNLVQGSGTNQIAESLQQEQRPIKAFVVSGEVTSAQSLDRNIEENASI